MSDIKVDCYIGILEFVFLFYVLPGQKKKKNADSKTFDKSGV